MLESVDETNLISHTTLVMTVMVYFQGVISTLVPLRKELPFVFLSEEEKGSLCLNHVKPLKSPQPKLLDWSILFSFVKLAFRVQASVY